MKIICVVGARPNFMKISPIIREIKKYKDIDYRLVHTGQHYDKEMSEVFFNELEIPEPDCNFNIGSKSQGIQTGQIMSTFDLYCSKEKPDIVLVIGDVNSTLACGLVASKIPGVKLAHVESGARSFDREMPEEINRVVVDTISDYLFTTTEDHSNNLTKEGVDLSRIFLVGNTMIDNLKFLQNKIKDEKDKEVDPFILATIHRQANTDNEGNLKNIIRGLNDIALTHNVIFPIHPRTLKMIKKFNLNQYIKNIDVRPPMNQIDFIKHMIKAKTVVTDSGGIQVETTALNIPCVTIRPSTEWNFTVTEGTNILVQPQQEEIILQVEKSIARSGLTNNHLSKINQMSLDGHASERIIKILT